MIIWFNEIGISFVRGGGSEPPACDAKPLKITFSVEDGMEYRYYYDTDTSKWYIRNDQGQYEEYGRYDASSATTYEGKLVVSDGYEYEWNGTQWVNLGEGGASLPKTYPSIDTYENWADSEFNYPETFNTQDSKWWIKNNQNHYEEYGVYADSIDSGVTTYEGKLALIPVDSGSTVDEYEYSGGTWNYLGSGSPTPYTEVEYLYVTERMGCSIDTGIKAGGTTVFKGKIMYDGYIGGMLFGTLGSTNPLSSNDNNDWRLVYASVWGGRAAVDVKSSRSNYFNFSAQTWYSIEMGNNYLKDLDSDTYIYSGTPVSATWNSDCSFFLFNRKTSDADTTTEAGKIGLCQIYNGGELVRDFVPCKDENGVPCMYDKITEQYYYTATSVIPLAGPEVSPAGSLPKEYADKPAPDLEMVTANIYCDLYQDSAITAGNYIGREAVVLDEVAVYKVNSGKKWEYLYPISNTLTYTTTDSELLETIPQSGWGANLLANIQIEGENTLIFDTAPTSIPVMGGQTKLVGMELPEGLTSIPAGAFSGCTALRSIDIPSGVTSIGDNAFRDCTSITGMILPNSLTSIGSGIFNGCSYLTSIDIPSGITSIPNEAFKGCSRLSSVTIPNTVTSIGNNAFYYDYLGLTSIVIPDSVTSIGDSAFAYCQNISSVTLPSRLTSINNSTFTNCWALTSISIPDSVTNIGNSAFSTCPALTSVTLSSGLTSIGSSAFQGCTHLTGITLPSGVTTVQNKTFSGCTSLSSITFNGNVTRFNEDAFRYCAWSSFTIPDTVTYMGKSVFEGCRNMTEIHIGSGVTSLPVSFVYACSGLTTVDWGSNSRVTSIGADAFVNCKALSSITIPASLNSIGIRLFNECNNLSEIIAYPTTAPTLGSATYFQNVAPVGTLYVPSGSDYSSWLTKLPSGWSIVYSTPKLKYKTSDTLTVSVPQIGWDANNTVTVVSNTYNSDEGCCVVEFSDTPTKMPDSAFNSSSGLTEVVSMPDTITSIGSGAFSGCTGLTAITIPDSVTTIGDNAFRGCSTLPSITIPDSVTSMGASVFEACVSMQTIHIGSGLTAVPQTAFFACSGLTSIDWGNNSSITSIGRAPFQYCTSLLTLVIPSGVTSIGSYPFANNRNLSTIIAYPTTAPSTSNPNFNELASSGTLYVPTGSDYSTWLANLPSGWSIAYM